MSFLSAQWHVQTNGILHQNFVGYAIDAVNENTAAFILHTDSSHVYLTQSSGHQWDLIFSIFPEDIIDISIIDEEKIWFCTGYPASIYNTLDGGETWIEQFSDSTITPFFNYIEMFDENNGIAMGDVVSDNNGPAIFLRTTNGGIDWVSVNDSAFGGYSGDLWRRIDFVDLNTGYYRESGINPNLLFKTADGCATWTSTSLPQNYGHVLKFYDENIGIAVDFRSYNRTFDGGLNWEESVRPDTNDPNWGIDVEFHPTDPSKVWFAGGNQVFFSSDSGVTWNVEFSNSGIRDIVFVDENTGWILTDNGVFHKGELFIIDETLIPQTFKLHQPYPNPFNPVTHVDFTVPEVADVSFAVYSLLGQEVMSQTIVYQPGTYKLTWNGRDQMENILPSGVYILKMESDSFLKTKKLVLMK